MAASAQPAARTRGPYAKSSDTRARILAAALEVVSELGLHRAQVAKIAERAGVAVGNVHYHFGSRDELLREVMGSLVGELHAALEAALPASAPLLEREEAAFRTYLAFLQRHPAWIRLSEEARLLYPDLYQLGVAIWLGMFREGLEEAVDRGELPPLGEGEIHALGHFLLGTRYFLDQLLSGANGEPYPGDEVVVATYLSFVQGALAK